MSTSNRPSGSASTNGAPAEPSYFEQQREILVGEIGQSLENVLHNINRLNRSLEGIIAVGNEFSSVEALWSQFENVMAKDPDAAGAEGREEGSDEDDTTVNEEARS